MTDWESVVHDHGDMAFDTAWRILGHAADAEDVVQDALLAAFSLHRRQPIANWGGLLRHLTTCRALDCLRKRRPMIHLTHEPTCIGGTQPEQVAVERELAERLRTAVAELPDREASVFAMRYFGEMSNTEIAEALGLSANAVGVILHKARDRLANLLRLVRPSQRTNSDERADLRPPQ